MLKGASGLPSFPKDTHMYKHVRVGAIDSWLMLAFSTGMQRSLHHQLLDPRYLHAPAHCA